MDNTIRMDTRLTTHRGSSPRSFGIAEAVFLCLCVVCVDISRTLAEPPPSIRATGKTQSLTVIDTSQPLIFPEQSWKLTAPNHFGPTITVWSIAPFRNVADSQIQIDAALNLTIGNRGKDGNWQVLMPHDRTHFSSGRTAAHVVAGSQGGNGDAGITVTFLCHEQPFVADGEYEATVVGTITEAF